jgi:choline dehydrogenase-like flavoprotein
MATTNGVNGVSGANGVNGHTATAHVSAEEFLKTDFDYVICGGGTAGLVVAARLSENPDVTVGVIEAGKNKLGDPAVDIPMMFTSMFSNPEYDWAYKTTPQKCNNNIVHHVVRGKMLGGSSGINYMMYVRGSLQDWDDWAELAGDEGWSSAHMMEYMKKHETLEPIEDAVIDRTAMPFLGKHHGTSGPVRTSFNDNSLPIEADMIKAADEATGLSKKPIDPWSGEHIGFYNTLGAVVRTGPNRGKRSYTARGYYQANEHRPNLKVVTESVVAKIVLENGQATGVQFITGGQKHTVKAKREVVVAGGSIGSPQILELSGIGNPEVLKAAGVDCLVDLPTVGEDFQDHCLTWTSYKLAEGQMSADSIHKPEIMEMAQKALMETGGGPLTNVSCVQGFFPAKWFMEEGELDEIVQSIENTKGGSEFAVRQRKQIIEHIKSDKSANLQFVLVPVTPNTDGVKDQSVLFAPPADVRQPDGVTLAICLEYPVARGYVHIKSSDPFEHPEIEPNYLGHEADVAMLGAGVKFLDKMANSPALKGKLAERTGPAPEVDLSDKQARRDYVKEMVMVSSVRVRRISTLC